MIFTQASKGKNINDKEINGHVENEFEKCTETIVSDASLSKRKAKSYRLSQKSVLVVVLSDTANDLDGGREECPF